MTASDPETNTSYLAWQDDALCAQIGPAAFFPEQGESIRDGKKICASCEVRAQCLDYALTTNQDSGVWGGLGEQERKKLKRQGEAAIKRYIQTRR